MTAAEHLVIAPILIPFFAGALLLFLGGGRRRTRRALSLASAACLLLVAALLLGRAGEAPVAGDGALGTYLLGDWPIPYGIVLTLDRLAATMLVLVALLAIPVLLHASAGWDRQGQHFHALFQFLLMGLNGAFLTGDLFNLFVFFEVLLAASYGLLLHGSGPERVRAGLHYIAINLTASLMFLIGVSLVYGVTGTLNMAHLAALVPAMPEADRPFLHLGMAFLGLAFLVKAGIWPLSFWLPGAYATAAPPVAAMFAIMTKVGVYALLRLSTLVFGEAAGPSAGFGAGVLVGGGMLTVAFGLLGVLGSRTLGHMAAHMVLISAGTTLAVAGFAHAGGGAALLAGGLYYLVGSTLASSALFLLIGPLSRGEEGVAAPPLPPADPDGADAVEDAEDDGDEEDEVGLPIPGAVAILASCFAGCVLVLAGMPPLAGFVGKVAILSSLLEPDGMRVSPGLGWAFLALLLLSGLATLIGLTRVGIRVFWAGDGEALKAWPLEVGPVVGLLAVVGAMTVWGEGVMGVMDATAAALRAPLAHAAEVISAPRVEDSPEGAE